MDKWWHVRTKLWAPSHAAFAAVKLLLCQSGTVMEKFCLSLRSAAGKQVIMVCFCPACQVYDLLSPTHIRKKMPVKLFLVTSNYLWLLFCCRSQDSWPVGASVRPGHRGRDFLKRLHRGEGRVQQNMHTTQIKSDKWLKKYISLLFKGF